MNKPDGGSAFPSNPPTYDPVIGYQYPNTGMTLRDYFAAKAMLGILQARVDGLRPEDLSHVAADAYFIADSMIAEKVKS